MRDCLVLLQHLGVADQVLLQEFGAPTSTPWRCCAPSVRRAGSCPTSCARTSPPSRATTSPASTARRRTGPCASPTRSTGIVERDVDRMVIDLAEPWRLLDRAAEALRPGAVLTAFVPTALQVKSHVDALRRRRTLRRRRDVRDAAALLARRTAEPASRAPHGGAHRVPDRRATSRATLAERRAVQN